MGISASFRFRQRNNWWTNWMQPPKKSQILRQKIMTIHDNQPHPLDTTNTKIHRCVEKAFNMIACTLISAVDTIGYIITTPLQIAYSFIKMDVCGCCTAFFNGIWDTTNSVKMMILCAIGIIPMIFNYCIVPETENVELKLTKLEKQIELLKKTKECLAKETIEELSKITTDIKKLTEINNFLSKNQTDLKEHMNETKDSSTKYKPILIKLIENSNKLNDRINLQIKKIEDLEKTTKDLNEESKASYDLLFNIQNKLNILTTNKNNQAITLPGSS